MKTLLDLVQDVRYGARTIARNPGFAVAGIVTLALGLGLSCRQIPSAAVTGLHRRATLERAGAERAVTPVRVARRARRMRWSLRARHLRDRTPATGNRHPTRRRSPTSQHPDSFHQGHRGARHDWRGPGDTSVDRGGTTVQQRALWCRTLERSHPSSRRWTACDGFDCGGCDSRGPRR